MFFQSVSLTDTPKPQSLYNRRFAEPNASACRFVDCIAFYPPKTTYLFCQSLQTFPKNFKWGDTIKRRGINMVRVMIGEAVPPLFTYQHGKILHKILRGSNYLTAMPNSEKAHQMGLQKLNLLPKKVARKKASK